MTTLLSHFMVHHESCVNMFRIPLVGEQAVDSYVCAAGKHSNDKKFGPLCWKQIDKFDAKNGKC